MGRSDQTTYHPDQTTTYQVYITSSIFYHAYIRTSDPSRLEKTKNKETEKNEIKRTYHVVPSCVKLRIIYWLQVHEQQMIM